MTQSSTTVGTATTVFTAHSSASIPRRDGTGNLTIHQFNGADGRRYDFFEGPKADLAYSLYQSQTPATIEYTARTSADGRFTNFRGNQVSPAQVQLPGAPAPAPATQAPPPAAPRQAPTDAAEPYLRRRHPSEAAEIMRQSALGHALRTAEMGLLKDPSFEGVIGLADRYCRFFEQGSAAVLEQAAVDRATTPPPAPSAQLGPDDDIPF